MISVGIWVGGALAGGFLLGGPAGVAVAAGVAAIGLWRPRPAALIVAGLLLAAAGATVFEHPLSEASVPTFSIDRELAADLGRHAGVALLATVLMAVRRERARAPLRHRVRVAGPTVAALGARVAATLAVALLAAGVVLGQAGDRSYGWATGPLVAASAALGAVALLRRPDSREARPRDVAR